MRPKLLLCLMLALVSGPGSRADAQTTQRPSQLRQAPNGGPNAHSAQPGVVTRAAPPVVEPERTGTRAEPAGSGLGDAAWTSTPVRSQSRGQSPAPSPNAQLTPVQVATTQVRLTDQASQVVPAQFTSSDSPGQPATQESLPLATTQSSSTQSSTNQPRALRPPTSAMDRPSGQSSGSTLQMLVSVLSSLGIVIGLIVGAGWCYRKAAPKLTGALPKQAVNILGRTQLAPRQQLVLIRFGSKLVLVSNLQGEVRTLSEMTDPLEVDQIAGLCESAQPGSISESFRSVLHNMSRNGT